jgi:hypothetical protein
MGAAKYSLTALTMAATRLPRVVYGMSPSLPRQSFFSIKCSLNLDQGQRQSWQSTYRGENKDTNKNDSKAILYLHIGPSGDCWTGHSIFAAKHLQPDYVRSVALPPNFRSDEHVEALLEAIGEDSTLQHQIYDDEEIPESLFDKIRADVPGDC